MDVESVKEVVRELAQYLPFRLPATGWYFATEEPRGSITLDDNGWTCMFKLVERVAMGERVCFSAQKTGCRYAAFYLGFETPGTKEGAFLATEAQVKKTVELGIGHYGAIQAPAPKEDYLVLERIEDMDADVVIEVVNLWGDALSLTGLVTLANYECSTNDRVLIPYAAGCQSIWTVPYKEAFQESPRAVIGAIDPVVRNYLPPDTLSFSIPIQCFVEMSKNVPDSFLKREPWTRLITRLS